MHTRLTSVLLDMKVVLKSFGSCTSLPVFCVQVYTFLFLAYFVSLRKETLDKTTLCLAMGRNQHF